MTLEPSGVTPSAMDPPIGLVSDDTVHLSHIHQCIARRIAGNTEWHVREEGWECPPVEEALEAAGLWPMKEYTRRRKVTIEE